MSGTSKYLEELSRSQGTHCQNRQEGSQKQQVPSGLRSSVLPPINSMPPPAAKPALSSQGRKTTSLQKQAVMQAATAAPPGPLGTIPDDAPLEAAGGSSPSALAQTDIKQYTLTSWDSYFDDSKDLHLADRHGTFRVYTAGVEGPVVFFLHGGGYSGLTWAMLAKQLKGRCRLVAFDQRGHGKTVTDRDDDLSAAELVADAVAVWRALFAEEQPPVVLAGHSMGGAVAVRTAATKDIANLQGLVVIDVVEGTAMSSLPHMMNVLRQRPSTFPSILDAVHWARKSAGGHCAFHMSTQRCTTFFSLAGMSKNTEAACISIPSCLVQQHRQDASGLHPDEVSTSEGPWAWRTPLAASQPFWEGWYKGLSDMYMSVIIPKILVLAGTDRLDRALTVGQMQGKFQLVLLPQAGHAVHEDQYVRTAEVIASFMQRFRIGLPKMQIPTAGHGATRVLPVAAGPLFSDQH